MFRNPALILLIALLTIVSQVVAQEATPEVVPMPRELCTPEGRNYVSQMLQAAIERLATEDDPSFALLFAQIAIASYRADCAQLIFTDAEHGTDVVTDPIAFRSGFYRVTFESSGFAAVSLDALGGNCPFLSMLLPDGGQDQATAEFDGCVGVLDITGREGWTLTFEPLAFAN